MIMPAARLLHPRRFGRVGLLHRGPLQRVGPSVMIMCPCVDGLSHNEAETISKDWAAAGADVLFHAVVETAEIVE